MRRFVFVSLAVLLLPRFAIAQDRERSQETLKGIKSVNVVIDLSGVNQAANFGLDEETVRTDTELQLRLAGVAVTSDTLDPLLGVVINGMEAVKGRFYFYVVEVQLYQPVVLMRDVSIRTDAITWSTSTMLGLGRETLPASLREAIKDQTDVFVNGLLAANPKSPSEKQGEGQRSTPP